MRRDHLPRGIRTVRLTYKHAQDVGVEFVTEDLVARPVVINHGQPVRQGLHRSGEATTCGGHDFLGFGDELSGGHVFLKLMLFPGVSLCVHRLIQKQTLLPMKSLKTLTVALALFAGVSAFAQPPADAPKGERPRGQGGPGGPGGGGMAMSAEDRLKQLKEALGITDEQATKLKPILVEEAAALKAIVDDKSLEREARREKMRGVRDSFQATVRERATLGRPLAEGYR